MYWPRVASKPTGMGVVPVIWALYAGGAALAAGAGGLLTHWTSSDCRSWWCEDNLVRSGTTEPPTPRSTGFAPSAPKTREQMTVPGAWTPTAMYETTVEKERRFREGGSYVGTGGGTGVPGGVAPTPEIPWIPLALIGVGVVLAVR